MLEKVLSSLFKGLYDPKDSNQSRLQELEEKLSALAQEKEGLLEHYRILTGNLAAAVIIRDKDQKISYCSPYTEVLTGYALSDIYACADDFFLNVVHEEDREKYQRALKVSAMGEPFQYRYRFYHKTGLEMWAETRTVPVTSAEGAPLFSLSITLDVTGTVRYQKQVEEKNRELRDFTYMVSHDLKAPIFTIKGMLGIIKEDHQKQLEPELDEALGHIERAANRLDLLVKSVLEYSRVSTTEIKLEAISLQEVLQEISEEFKTQLQECSANLEIAPNLPRVRGDRLKLFQILSNLINNAIKYREAGRTSLIRVWAAPGAAHTLEIYIEDNGLGIPADKLEQIFRPFQRLHASQAEGNGIGLACAKRLAEKLGGDIRVESKEGQGSKFTVILRAE